MKAGFSLPVACEPGRTCFVQHHVDIDPTSGVRDFACGSATYDGHDGVDIRLLSAAAAKAGVAVVAPARGRVLRVRDGVGDAFARETGRAAIKGKECGNGLVVGHGGGLETQYCHLLSGSISVKPGQPVERGAVLGKVGYSGLADFAHLHFTVRRNGQVIDPFSGLAGGKQGGAGADRCLAGAASAPPAGSLWNAATAAHLPYRAAEVIQAGFAAAIPDWIALERDHASYAKAEPLSAGLVLFARVVNLGASDRIRLVAEGPGGYRVEHLAPPPGRQKAIFLSGAGRKRTTERWPAGRYTGKVEILRDGKPISASAVVLDLP
ncbi:MAG: M23 family metallopeptidase [Hyphomicrobiaceae bacterium]